MKRIYLLILLILFSTFNLFSMTETDIKKILSLADKLKQKDVKNIEIIYDWGDGQTDSVPISKISDKIRHFYEKEGNYIVTTKINFKRYGKEYTKIIKKDDFYYKCEKNINYDLKVIVPKIADQNKKVKFKAYLKLSDNNLRTKNIKYQWFIDDPSSQYEEGKETHHIFNIPSSSSKLFYNIKLKVIFKYSHKNKPNVWLPFIIEKTKKIKIKRTSKVEISEYTKFVEIKNGKFESPFFITLKDSSYFNNEYFYKKTNIFYKPVIYINNNVYNCEFVDLVKDKKNGIYSNKINYLLNVNRLKYIPIIKNNKKYLKMKIKVNDPNGLVKKDIYIEII